MMVEMDDLPLAVWADLLEDAGEDTAALRSWLEWGNVFAGGRYGGYVQWMRTSHGTGGGVTLHGNGYQHAADRGGEGVGDGFGCGGRYGEGCGYEVRITSEVQTFVDAACDGCGIGYVNRHGLGRGSGYC